MLPPSKHKTDARNPSTQDADIRPLKDRVYVHFADEDQKLSDDPNLKYKDETNAYTTISTRGYFTPNPRISDHNYTSPTRQFNSLGASDRLWPIEHTSDESKRDMLGIQDRGQDAGVSLLSARSYEMSPSRKRQSSPRQSQGPLADKIGKGEEQSIRETPSQEISTKTSPVVCECDQDYFHIIYICKSSCCITFNGYDDCDSMASFSYSHSPVTGTFLSL